MSSNENPPSFERADPIELTSVEASKITGVSLYSGRAEVTRLFKFAVKTGQNHVHINGLPSCMDRESLRIEGRGAATIHDVTVSDIPIKYNNTAAETVMKLEKQRARASDEIQRHKLAIEALGSYVKTLNIEHLDPSKLPAVLSAYEENARNLEDKIEALEDSVKRLGEEIAVERKKINQDTDNRRLRDRVSVGVFAESEGDVEVAVIYAVHEADWHALYDVRVDMQTKEKPVAVIYKAAISQRTGESWDDVPLTLETATPSFGVAIPDLSRWNISKYQPPPPRVPIAPVLAQAAPAARGGFGHRKTLWADEVDDQPRMTLLETSVTSKGNVSATFQIPGTVTIPSDGELHNFTIVELGLEAEMTWVVVPKQDNKVHLKAKVLNASEYTFLAGCASVYVDGSFIARAQIPGVSSQEKFDCPLGLDPSIRVTYHPLEKKAAQSGFYNKTSKRSFTQRITVHNTKTIPVQNFKVIDQFPVSEDAQIIVKHESPALPQFTASADEVSKEVKVSDGVVAQWDGADDAGSDTNAIGRDGKFCWICSIPEQGKLNLQVKWEVSAPEKERIVGL